MKNLVIAALVGLVAFVAISIRSEMRGLGPVDYGGHESDVSSAPAPASPPAQPIEMVSEAPASSFVDERLGDPPPPPSSQIAPEAEAVAPRVEADVVGDEIAIVGGPEGVTIVHQTRRRSTLSGGFGRP